MNGINWQQRNSSDLFDATKPVKTDSPQKMETDEKKSSTPSQSPMQTPNPTQSFSLQGASQQEACRWVKLGNAERSKNEIGKAIDCYRKAVALNSSYLDPLQKIEGGYKLAATLLHRKSEGDLQESLQLFQGITQASKYLESAHPKLLQKILANYVFALTQRGTQRTRGCSFAKRWRA